MNTTAATILILATAVPAVIHMAGWDQTKIGKIIISVLVDIAGAYKAAKKDREE